jgi:hypothetical protein
MTKSQGRCRVKYLLVSGLLVLFARVAQSQLVVGPATFTPSAPTAQDTIHATYSLVSAGCGTSSSTALMGSTVRTTVFVSGCLIGPPPTTSSLQSTFGPIPSGTYSYEIYEVYEGGAPQLISSQPLVVAPAIPALLPAALAALAIVLVGVGFLALRRNL